MTETRSKDRRWTLVLAGALGVAALALPLSADAQLPTPPSLPSPPSIDPVQAPSPPAPPPVNTPTPPPVNNPAPPPVSNPTPVSPPSITVPSVTTPPVTAPSVTVPSVSTPVGTTPSVSSPSATAPTVTSPSLTADPTAPSKTTSSVTSGANSLSGASKGTAGGNLSPSGAAGHITGLGGAIRAAGRITQNRAGGGITLPVIGQGSGSITPSGLSGQGFGLGGGSVSPGGGVPGPRLPGGSPTPPLVNPGTTNGLVLTTNAGVPRFFPGAPGFSALPILAGANPNTVSPIFTDPLGRTLFGGPASGDSLGSVFGGPRSGVALIAAGTDPRLGVLGINPVAGVPLAYAGTTAAGGLIAPAALIATVSGLPGAPGGGSGPNDRNVIEQVGHAIDTVIAHLPDWSRPIIAGLLVLLLFFGVQAWRNARRARKTLLQNEVMQSALVPALPEHVADLDVSGGYRAADEVAQGGDFYDVFALDEHRTGIILGDVSGHDMKALNRSNEVRHKLRTLLEAGYEEHWEVRRVLAKASNALSKQWLDGDFVTAAVAIHDADTGTLTYACAGHPAPLLMGVAHHEPVSACSSPALGWGLPTGRRQTTVLLGEHETACFFTDGLIEARIKGSFLGRDGLEALVRDLGETGSADDLLRSVIARAHEAEDDLAALVLRPTASVPSDTLRVEELEFSAADARRRVPERFLAACDAPDSEIERLGEAAHAATTDGRLAVLRVAFSANGHVDARIVASGAPDPQSLVAA